MNLLDGMDVLVISYAANPLAAEWGITPETLGVVFSAGLLGMAAGAVMLAPMADVFGRRRIILLSLLIMSGGILATAQAQSLIQLILLRFVSGLGIGAMLASTATITAEFSPERQKNFLVSFVLTGFTVGATLSGFAAASIIPEFGWRSMFIIAGAVTALTFPVVYVLLPESLEFLMTTQPRNALRDANRILESMGHEPLDALPPLVVSEASSKVSALFAGNRANSTSWLWFAFFMSFVTLYFLISWIPQLAATTGLPLNLAIYAGAIFNLGAFFGILVQGYFSYRAGLRRMISVLLVASSLLMVVVGFVSGSWELLLVFGMIGFGVQGGFTGLYSVAARLYPTEIRTTGVGWSIGLGRTGAIVGPAVGGLLIGAGLSMSEIFIAFAVPLVLAAIATAFIRSSEVS